MEPKSISLPEELLESLDSLAEEAGYRDARGPRSKLIREIVSAAVTKWHDSPYVATSARNVVLVTREGHLFYRQVQVLKLNKKRDRLPCLLDFHASRRAGMGAADEAEQRWMLNHFAAWHGEGDGVYSGTPLDTWVDRSRGETKMADLLVEQRPERILTREIVAGLENYVRWKGKEPQEDRVDFPIDIPTLNLTIIVVVDMDLYRQTAMTEGARREIPDLRYELRNRESARFEAEAVVQDKYNPMSPKVAGKCMGLGIAQRAGAGRREREREAEVRKHVVDLTTRIGQLASAQVNGGPVVAAKSRESVQAALRVPEAFLYYVLGWRTPYLGVEVGIQWEKPEQPS